MTNQNTQNIPAKHQEIARGLFLLSKEEEVNDALTIIQKEVPKVLHLTNEDALAEFTLLLWKRRNYYALTKIVPSEVAKKIYLLHLLKKDVERKATRTSIIDDLRTLKAIREAQGYLLPEQQKQFDKLMIMRKKL